MTAVVARHPSAKLGRYEVIKHLASGGMAEVLLARAAGIEGFERYVVIKRIHVERARDPHVVKMFCDEARLAASMHHHNIVQVHDIGQEKGEYFFAMEYVHGEDLRRLLTTVNRAGGTIPTAHVLTIITAAASALHYAHDHKSSNGTPYNIVHRDVSPANILVGYDGEVKVVDFGIAKASFRSAETQSGTLKGKISYMAPEQCLGAAVDRRSDVFALGIVLFELFTVRRLFKGSSDFLTMSAIVAGNTPAPSTFRPDTPPELEAIIMKALAHKPEDRYQSANELRIALEDYASTAGIRISTTSLGEYLITLFGRRSEPWLVEDNEVEMEIADVDFDGPANNTSNSQRTPTGMPTPPPGSLLARARRKMAPAGGVAIPEAPKPAEVVAAESAVAAPSAAPAAPAAGGWGADDRQPTTASGTPLAWSPAALAGSAAEPAPAIAPKRGRIAIAVVAALTLGGVLILRPWAGGDESAPAAPAAAARAPIETSTPPPPVPVEPAVPPPLPASDLGAAVVEPVKAVEPDKAVAVAQTTKPAAKPAKRAKTKRFAVKKPPTKTGPAKTGPDKPRYDPKSLFPK